MAYNFMSLFRHALINPSKKKFLKTIRHELISTPAYLERTKDKHILYLTRSLKTRQLFLSTWEKIKGFLFAVRHREILMTAFGFIFCLCKQAVILPELRHAAWTECQLSVTGGLPSNGDIIRFPVNGNNINAICRQVQNKMT